MKHLTVISILCLSSSWIGLIGCGGGPDDQPELAAVEGTVKLDGKPLPGARLRFDPMIEKQGRPSYGETDENGYYTLKYTRGVEGAMIGEHRVVITTYREGGGYGGGYGGDGKNGPPDGTKEKVPAKYNVKSELRKKVKPGTNTINFDLDSEGEIIQESDAAGAY